MHEGAYMRADAPLEDAFKAAVTPIGPYEGCTPVFGWLSTFRCDRSPFPDEEWLSLA